MVQPGATCPDGTCGTNSCGDETRSHYSWSGGDVGFLTIARGPLSPSSTLMSWLGARGVVIDELCKVHFSVYEGLQSRRFVSLVEVLDAVAATPDLKLKVDDSEDGLDYPAELQNEVQDVLLGHRSYNFVSRHHSTLRFSTPTALLNAFPILSAHRNWRTMTAGTGSGAGHGGGFGARGGFQDDGGSGMVTLDAADDAGCLGLGEDGDTCKYGGGDAGSDEPYGGGDIVLRPAVPVLRNYGAARRPHDEATTEETMTADERDLAYMARSGGDSVWGT
jgi:hypothetical protein